MEFKTFNIPEDIVTLSVTADRFPEGIQGAFKNLMEKITDFNGRQCFGVTETVDGKYQYKALAKENSPEERDKYKLPVYIIPRGTYLYVALNDWHEHMELFGSSFQQLMQHPQARKNTIALEYYTSPKDVMLMVQHQAEVAVESN